MKYLVAAVLLAYIALVAGQDREYPIFDRTCDERKLEMRDSVKQDFNVAAVSESFLGKFVTNF